jgi:hypothetical protein
VTKVDQRKVRTRSRILVAALAIGLALGLGTAPAMAGNAIGSKAVTGTIGGKTWWNQATIYTSPGSAQATTHAGPWSTSAAAGHAGAQGRVMASGDALKCLGSMTYSTTTLAAQSGTSGLCRKSMSGAYYSYGVTHFWNGSGYSIYLTHRSPSQNS